MTRRGAVIACLLSLAGVRKQQPTGTVAELWKWDPGVRLLLKLGEEDVKSLEVQYRGQSVTLSPADIWAALNEKGGQG